MGSEWAEVRATQHQLLDRLPTLVSDPGSGIRYEAVLSLVVPELSQGFRQLPSLYFGLGLTFTARHNETVVERAELFIGALQETPERSLYLMNACRIGNRYGLFARDQFARSAYRRKLTLAGAEFASDPFVSFEDGHFSCADYGTFRPEFLILLDAHHEDREDSDPTSITHLPPGMMTFAMVNSRLGRISLKELEQLSRWSVEIPSFCSQDPRSLVAALRSSRS